MEIYNAILFNMLSDQYYLENFHNAMKVAS
jgi:hypothetical protein